MKHTPHKLLRFKRCGTSIYVGLQLGHSFNIKGLFTTRETLSASMKPIIKHAECQKCQTMYALLPSVTHYNAHISSIIKQTNSSIHAKELKTSSIWVRKCFVNTKHFLDIFASTVLPFCTKSLLHDEQLSASEATRKDQPCIQIILV